MNVREFATGTSGKLSAVYKSQAPLSITWQHKDYVTVAPTSQWNEAAQALEIVKNLRRMGFSDLVETALEHGEQPASSAA